MSILNTVRSYARSSAGRQAAARFGGGRRAGRRATAPSGIEGLLRRVTGGGGTRPGRRRRDR